MSKPIKAYPDENNSRIYIYEDGKKERWSGGTRSWRNNNPGNIEYSVRNDWQGQIGRDPRFVIFDTVEHGRRAIKVLLKTYAKHGHTLESAIKRYAPKHENNTEAYLQKVVEITGISRNTPLIKLTEPDYDRIVHAIEVVEVYRPGEITVIGEESKQQQKTGGYIWRTQGDGKVRSSHALRDGQIFSWDNPPEGGHPGEAPGCRCTAEPLVDEEKSKQIAQQLFD